MEDEAGDEARLDRDAKAYRDSFLFVLDREMKQHGMPPLMEGEVRRRVWELCLNDPDIGYRHPYDLGVYVPVWVRQAVAEILIAVLPAQGAVC